MALHPVVLLLTPGRYILAVKMSAVDSTEQWARIRTVTNMLAESGAPLRLL